jgi:phasin family protein
MFEPIQKANEDLQKMGKDNFDAVLRSYGELNKGFQHIGARMTEYSKQAFEDATRTFEKLLGAKSIEDAIEIQSQYAKRAYEAWLTEASRLGEMYVAATRDVYTPAEQAVAKKTPSPATVS